MAPFFKTGYVDVLPTYDEQRGQIERVSSIPGIPLETYTLFPCSKSSNHPFHVIGGVYRI